ncbi:P-loop containing nucleoside triphosphate hydrolase protein [Meredithblackwellia eburnea MCA 4105]
MVYETLLTVQDLEAPQFGTAPPLWSGVQLEVKKGTILCVRGPSGSGKSVLLKCIASLLVYDKGEVRLLGQTARELGVPLWRSRILYLPQRPALLPGTPNEFFTTLKGFKSRRGLEASLGDPKEVAKEWGIAAGLFDQTWGSLSGGEAQRIALAIALALKPTILLLDEPTSALDAHAATLVEDTILRGTPATRQTCLWITHSDEQCQRVATSTFDLSGFLNHEV